MSTAPLVSRSVLPVIQTICTVEWLITEVGIPKIHTLFILRYLKIGCTAASIPSCLIYSNHEPIRVYKAGMYNAQFIY